jgi:predicted enzyme related to lactoylglutathione lyase
VRDLKSRGVVFEVYEMPGVQWDGEIASLPGLGRAAWFRDSEGNVMCVDQAEVTPR